ncbi:MAG: lipopolysaccharide heptosyltransferase II [Gemmataceae bacterium]|nr:lipopolysaccharide heptosyltransferase II [Gemmataceae bacterium]
MNLAVFLPNWVGDVVMATPALRALRAHYSSARLIGVCRPYVSGVLDGAPWLDERIFLDRGGPRQQRWPAVAWQLRKQQIDLAVLFPNSFRSALVAWLGGCYRIVGFKRHGRGWMLTNRLHAARDADGRFKPTPIIDDYNRLAETAGCPAPGHRLELFTTPADEQAADTIWRHFGLGRHREVICLNPGAAFGAAKHWDNNYVAALARELAERRGAGVLVLCGPGEREMARHIAALARHASVHSLADAVLSLGLTKALIRRATLLITTDSGPRHFAAAFDRPVITLFGPTHIAWTETYFAKAVHLQRQVPCGPCQERVCPTGDHRCMIELLPVDVFRAATELLARIERKAS